MPIRVYVEEAGCDRRKLDVQSIRRYLIANGYEIVSDPARADKIVLATCAFKQSEEDESIDRVRDMRGYDAQLIVYGCLPDIAGSRYPELSGIPFISPKSIDAIDDYFDDVTVPFSEVGPSNVIPRSPLDVAAAKRFLKRPLDSAKLTSRLRSTVPFGLGAGSTAHTPFNLFVCRGCVGQCSYCAIPRSIGTVRSKDITAVLGELEAGLEAGHRVFNILGDDPGCWGQDIGAEFPHLMRALLAAADQWAAAPVNPNGRRASFWIREIHPKHVTRFASMSALPGFSAVKGMLVPVQSGSDRLLELMQREHSSQQLLRALARIREHSPGIRLETQIILGFPTETDADFAATLDFVRDGRFSSVVVFPYHDKPDTVASEITEKVDDAVIQRRMHAAFKYFRTHRIKAYYSCP